MKRRKKCVANLVVQPSLAVCKKNTFRLFSFVVFAVTLTFRTKKSCHFLLEKANFFFLKINGIIVCMKGICLHMEAKQASTEMKQKICDRIKTESISQTKTLSSRRLCSCIDRLLINRVLNIEIVSVCLNHLIVWNYRVSLRLNTIMEVCMGFPEAFCLP